jgi:hypothetical protein
MPQYVPGSFASAVMAPRGEGLQGKNARHVDIHLGKYQAQSKLCHDTLVHRSC